MFPSGGKQKVSILQHSVPAWYPGTGSGPQARPPEYLKGPRVTAENFRNGHLELVRGVEGSRWRGGGG